MPYDYYISAYGLAVKKGFEGTLDEWLESLRGTPGGSAEMRMEGNAVQWRTVTHDGTAGEWITLYELSEDNGEEATGGTD